MSVSQKIVDEMRSLIVAMLYFATWLGVFLLLKKLILAEYQIDTGGLSIVLIGALVLSKVVLILEHVSLGARIRSMPVWVGVLLRTALYTGGVFVVVILEKSFEGRHEYGGLIPAMRAVSEGSNIDHVMATTICVAGALLGYNALSVIREHLGSKGLARLFMSAPVASREGSPANGGE